MRGGMPEALEWWQDMWLCLNGKRLRGGMPEGSDVELSCMPFNTPFPWMLASNNMQEKASSVLPHIFRFPLELCVLFTEPEVVDFRLAMPAILQQQGTLHREYKRQAATL